MGLGNMEQWWILSPKSARNSLTPLDYPSIPNWALPYFEKSPMNSKTLQHQTRSAAPIELPMSAAQTQQVRQGLLQLPGELCNSASVGWAEIDLKNIGWFCGDVCYALVLVAWPFQIKLSRPICSSPLALQAACHPASWNLKWKNCKSKNTHTIRQSNITTNSSAIMCNPTLDCDRRPFYLSLCTNISYPYISLIYPLKPVNFNGPSSISRGNN